MENMNGKFGQGNQPQIDREAGFTTTSDIRDKTDIEAIRDGAVTFLEKVEAIRYRDNPRSDYFLDESLWTEQDRENFNNWGFCSYDHEAHAAGTKKSSNIRVGVSAQSVQQAFQEVYGDKTYGDVVDDNLRDFEPSEIPAGVESQLAVTYANFIPFLIKAIQELNTKINTLNALKEDVEYLASQTGITLPSSNTED